MDAVNQLRVITQMQPVSQADCTPRVFESQQPHDPRTYWLETWFEVAREGLLAILSRSSVPGAPRNQLRRKHARAGAYL